MKDVVLPLAHGGDFAVDLVIFAVPVLAIAAWLLWSRVRGG